MSTLVIDSRRRNATGVGTLTQFSLQLTPALENVSRCRLVWADLPIPSGATESFYIITIPQLGCPVRGANSMLSGTFCIPVSSAGGYRSYWAENNSWHQIANGNHTSVTQLDVYVNWGNDNAPALLAGDWTIIIQLE